MYIHGNYFTYIHPHTPGWCYLHDVKSVKNQTIIISVFSVIRFASNSALGMCKHLLHVLCGTVTKPLLFAQQS